MRAGFRWDVPARFNIARVCCDDWAARPADRVAVTHLGEDGSRQVWTFAQLKAASDALAASFRARGVGQGDRVAVLLAQSPEVLISHFATWKLGAVALPLFVLFGPDALAYRLRDSGAKLVVTDAANLDKVMDLRAELPELAEIYCVDGGPDPVRDLHAEIAAANAPITPVDTAADDPAVLIYTSGTTGDPKGVLHAHRFLLGHLPSMEANHEGFPQLGDIGWTPADWAWIGGLMDMAMPCLYYGRPQISHRMRKFDPEHAYRLIRNERLTNLFLPPTALKLMRQADVPDGLNIRTISSGGEALGADLLDWGLEALGAPINELYGQTECNLVMASCHGSMPVKPGSMGQPLPGFDVTLLDGEGREVEGPGEGEIAVRRGTPVMFLRYWEKPEATAAKFSGDWLRTGDLARRDDDGYYWFASRDDDVITSSGYRIGPSEIETCLTGHPDVVMAAVIGLPDPVRTEAVTAYVVLRDGAGWSDALGEALVARVRERVSPHVAPRRIEPIDALPMTATGKIMRRALRERA
ncbi:AMP-binding protein [Pseudoruegeria sp. HB172150]|uniref:AMP-binding protein n=1 Tax=Pseudoruegeria sp. HB172150 TaxID=2721164 RepID=UPI001554B528|nr:AMP-binding protein [Pseudoruegeria sp. HB172150]